MSFRTFVTKKGLTRELTKRAMATRLGINGLLVTRLTAKRDSTTTRD